MLPSGAPQPGTELKSGGFGGTVALRSPHTTGELLFPGEPGLPSEIQVTDSTRMVFNVFTVNVAGDATAHFCSGTLCG